MILFWAVIEESTKDKRYIKLTCAALLDVLIGTYHICVCADLWFTNIYRHARTLTRKHTDTDRDPQRHAHACMHAYTHT